MTPQSGKDWRDAVEADKPGANQSGSFSPKKLIIIGIVVLLVGLWWRSEQPPQGDRNNRVKIATQQNGPRSRETQQDNEGTPQMQADPYPGYYRAYAMPPDLVEGEIALTAWGAAAEKYHTGDYEGAVAAFQEVLEAGGEMPVELVQFFLGQAHLAAGDAEPAAAAFQAVLEVTNDGLGIEARWYLALSCVRTGDVDTAKEQLRELVSGNNYNSDVAKMLLQQISG
jgi:TolA-binding protein